MKPLNLFLLTRVSELDEFLSLHRYLSQFKYKINQQIHEFISLKGFVDNSFNLGLNISDYDGFYYSYRSSKIYNKQYDLIVDLVVNLGKVCIFSSDKYQILSRAESRRKIWEKISSIPELEEYTLSEKIRTNMEMATFIRKVRNLNISEVFDSQNIEVVYSDDKNESKSILEYYVNYVNMEYTFINFSQSNYI